MENLPSVLNCQDHIIIWATSLAELCQRVIAYLKRIRASGLKLNLEKCQFEMTELDLLGHTLSENGI